MHARTRARAELEIHVESPAGWPLPLQGNAEQPGVIPLTIHHIFHAVQVFAESKIPPITIKRAIRLGRGYNAPRTAL